MANESTISINQISNSLSKLNNAAFSMVRRAVDSNMQFANEVQTLFAGMGLKLPDLGLGNTVSKTTHAKGCQCGCCPPECDCPPHCMIQVSRTAYPGETIIVPITVRNTTSSAKTYKVGVRELVDQQGQHAPNQPTLNQNMISLQSNQAITLLMTIDTKQFSVGTYETEVVLREKDVNQNICFKLQVAAFPNTPEAHLKEEQQLLTHFQGWQSHFYCTPKKGDSPLNLTTGAGTTLNQ